MLTYGPYYSSVHSKDILNNSKLLTTNSNLLICTSNFWHKLHKHGSGLIRNIKVETAEACILIRRTPYVWFRVMYPIGNVSYALALVQKLKQSFMAIATFMYITSHLFDIDLLPQLTACFGQFGFSFETLFVLIDGFV